MDDDSSEKLRTDLGSAVRQWERHGWSHRCIPWVEAESTVAAERTLLQINSLGRDLNLFDTFEEMQDPSENDVDRFAKGASKPLSEDSGYTRAVVPLERVRGLLCGTGYPKEEIHFVPRKMEDTLPVYAPDTITLLQLDPDLYASTKHELVHMYPRLTEFGEFIIDNYGQWSGSRRACNACCVEKSVPMLLHRIDFTGRIVQKP